MRKYQSSQFKFVSFASQLNEDNVFLILKFYQKISSTRNIDLKNLIKSCIGSHYGWQNIVREILMSDSLYVIDSDLQTVRDFFSPRTYSNF